jgi:hypothetical protein
MRTASIFICCMLTAGAYTVFAQYAPAAGEAGSTAIHKDSAVFEGWATGYKDYLVGDDVDEMWQVPDNALGKAQGTSFDIVCLGRGGEITLTFNAFILNKEGDDFAVFENSFNDSFLELAWVEVSLDGDTFVRFPNHSLTTSPVSDVVNPEKIYGYAGKYRKGYGTPFDLAEVGMDSVYYVRLIDIPGDGSAKDTAGNPVYDPYPTTGSAGFDLDAIGVIHKSSDYIGLEKYNAHDNIHIYPNPFVDGIYVSPGVEGAPAQICIMNCYGALLKQINHCNGNNYIELSQYPAGLYFIRIATVNKTVVKKIIKKK